MRFQFRINVKVECKEMRGWLQREPRPRQMRISRSGVDTVEYKTCQVFQKLDDTALIPTELPLFRPSILTQTYARVGRIRFGCIDFWFLS